MVADRGQFRAALGVAGCAGADRVPRGVGRGACQAGQGPSAGKVEGWRKKGPPSLVAAYI